MSAKAPEPIDPSFRIELPMFEGPLDLLLHLISKHELDILDLPIAFVTEKYLAYLGLMKQLNLDVAAEYLLMAAKLAYIKSRMLLPAPPDDLEDGDEDLIDPREELIKRLLEYQKYRRVAEDLGTRGIAGRDVFLRGAPGPEAEGPAPLAETSLFKLLDSFAIVLERAKADLAFEVSAERISIQQRITELVDVLQSHRQCRFDDLFEGVASTYEIVVTFLALLEMCKVRMLRVYQTDTSAELYLEYRVLDAEGTTPEAAAAEQSVITAPAKTDEG